MDSSTLRHMDSAAIHLAGAPNDWAHAQPPDEPRIPRLAPWRGLRGDPRGLVADLAIRHASRPARPRGDHAHRQRTRHGRVADAGRLLAKRPGEAAGGAGREP